jgi:hypothetical protein
MQSKAFTWPKVNTGEAHDFLCLRNRRRPIVSLTICRIGACDDGLSATKGEDVRVLSAAPALEEVPGSGEFAAKYIAKYGPINNYAASSYDSADSARVLMTAIAEAAKAKKAVPSRADVVASIRGLIPFCPTTSVVTLKPNSVAQQAR